MRRRIIGLSIGSLLVMSLVTLLLLASLVLAEEAKPIKPIKVTIIDNQINLGEEASFKIEITNTAKEKQRYSIYSFQSGQGWNVNPFPLKDRIVEIKTGETYSTTLLARPLESFSPGIYYVHVIIESDLGEHYSEALKIHLGSEKPPSYLPSITVTVDMNEKINPQELLPIKLFLDNRNPLDLKNVTLRIRSDIPEFVQETILDLPPSEQKTVEFTVKPNTLQQPKDYFLFFVFEIEKQSIKVVEKRIEIIGVESLFGIEATLEKSFLRKDYILKVTNNGNVVSKQEVKRPVSFVESWVSYGLDSQDSQVKKEAGQRYLVWEISLAPGESTTFNYTTNYRLLLYITIFLVLFISFYYYVRSLAGVTKSAVVVSGGGDISEIKVTLEVRNKSLKSLKNVTIVDSIPPIANLEKGLELGTLKPIEIRHTKQGTKVVWSLIELEGMEQRLITYKVKAKLNIIGTLSLPRATVEYKRGKRLIKAYSNIFRIDC